MKTILHNMAEQAAPANEINLRPALQAHFQTRTITQPRGFLMNTRYTPNNWLRFAAFLAAALILATGLYLMTPQGRALAQNVIRFFTRSEGNTISLPTPTTVSLVAVTPDFPQPTLTPTPSQPLAFASQCGNQSFPKCSLDQIRSLVKFKVTAIGEGPASAGLNFIGATGEPDQIWLVYRSKDLTQSLFLLEGTKVKEGFQGLKIAANTLVENVQIGAAGGEYVRGDWNGSADTGELKWDPNQPAQYLRWTAGDIYYEMVALSNPNDPHPWSEKTGLLSVAAGLTSTPATPTPVPVNENLSLAQAEQLAGFKILAPEKLPRDYTFSHARYSPASKTVCLVYRHPDDYGASLTIAESLTSPFPALNDLFRSFPNYGWHINAETLQVGGGLAGWGMLVKGSLNTNQFCVSKVETPVGSYSPETEVLQLQFQGLMISIYAQEFPSLFTYNFITRLEMLRLAESMTGIHTVPDNQLDPEYLTNVKDAEVFAGFHILQPTKLFPGEAFSYFRVVPEGLSRRVIIIYEKNLSISETILPGETFDTFKKDFPESKLVTVRGQPGVLNAEPGNSIGITWYENGIKYNIGGVYDGQPVEVWLAIAESMK